MRQRKAQRGFLLITAVVLVVVVSLLVGAMAFMFVTGSQSGADNLQSGQALFIAEAGLERALRQKTLSSAYTGETNTSYANGSFTITTYSTDFSGNPLLTGWVRMMSVGTTSTGGASRTVEAIVGAQNLFPPAANADFNSTSPPNTNPCVIGSCTPANWNLSTTPAGVFQPWDDTGGPETPPTRAAYAVKPTTGTSTATNAGSFAFLTPMVVTAPTTLSLTFNYKVVTTGATSSEVQLTFTTTDGTTTWTATPAPFNSGNTGTYQTGSVSFSITGTGTKSLNSLAFTMFLKAGQPKQAWLDNLSLNSGSGTAPLSIRYWREDFF